MAQCFHFAQLPRVDLHDSVVLILLSSVHPQLSKKELNWIVIRLCCDQSDGTRRSPDRESSSLRIIDSQKTVSVPTRWASTASPTERRLLFVSRNSSRDSHACAILLLQGKPVLFSGSIVLCHSLIDRTPSHPLQRDPSQRISTFNRFFLSFVFVSTALLYFIAASPRFARLEYLDIISYLSYIKLYISFAKYVPQVRLNYRRKSTVGWSIENILLGTRFSTS